MDTRYHKLVSLTGMVSGIFDSGVRLAIRDDQGRGFPYPSHLNHRPLLNTPSPQHLSSYSWAHLTPSKQQVLLSGDTGSQRTQEAEISQFVLLKSADIFVLLNSTDENMFY